MRADLLEVFGVVLAFVLLFIQYFLFISRVLCALGAVLRTHCTCSTGLSLSGIFRLISTVSTAPGAPNALNAPRALSHTTFNATINALRLNVRHLPHNQRRLLDEGLRTRHHIRVDVDPHPVLETVRVRRDHLRLVQPLVQLGDRLLELRLEWRGVGVELEWAELCGRHSCGSGNTPAERKGVEGSGKGREGEKSGKKRIGVESMWNLYITVTKRKRNSRKTQNPANSTEKLTSSSPRAR